MKIFRNQLLALALLLTGFSVQAQEAAEQIAPEATPEVAPEAAPVADEMLEEALPLPLDEVRIFTQVLEQIRSAYVEELDDKTLLENAIKGMLSGIDPHSTYLVNESLDQLQEDTTGEFGGLGVEISTENGLITIVAPVDGSPADRAGIKAGDRVIQIDDKPITNMSTTESVDMMRGEPGTSITLTVLREGEAEPLEIDIVREIITARSVRHRTLEPGYGYLRISQFMTVTGEQTRQALVSLQEDNQPLKGIIMDLRNNPGGVLTGAVEVVDTFIDGGLVVSIKGRLDNSNREFNATPLDPSEGVPLVVLIDGGSASASEIVAGALQDHERAIIMGTRSFGKGSVQTVLPLADTRAIKLTTALYYTPSGRSIQALGIVPDIIVDRGQVTRTEDNFYAYRESDLEGHLENSAGEVDDEEVQPLPQEILVRDYQLNEALNLLKGINSIKPANIPALSRLIREEPALPAVANNQEDVDAENL